jgi:hypothetical protein
MNWKDSKNGNSSLARASREVGGRYRIIFYPGGYKTWRGEIAEPFYEVSYCRSHRREWDSCCPRGRTFAEAKQLAEEDHEERRREAATARW